MNDFTKDEPELLASGFGFFVQDFPIPDDDPACALLSKLYQMVEESQRNESEKSVLP